MLLPGAYAGPLHRRLVFQLFFWAWAVIGHYKREVKQPREHFTFVCVARRFAAADPYSDNCNKSGCWFSELSKHLRLMFLNFWVSLDCLQNLHFLARRRKGIAHARSWPSGAMVKSLAPGSLQQLFHVCPHVLAKQQAATELEYLSFTEFADASMIYVICCAFLVMIQSCPQFVVGLQIMKHVGAVLRLAKRHRCQNHQTLHDF